MNSKQTQVKQRIYKKLDKIMFFLLWQSWATILWDPLKKEGETCHA